MEREIAGISAVLTHHWLVRRRGGEKVLEAIAELLPGTDVYALVCEREKWDREDSSNGLAGRTIHTSLLNDIPGATRHYPKMLPLMPWAARRLRLPAVDLVVCSDAAIAKAMTADERSIIACYCHSPMRYVWEPEISAQYAATVPRLLRPAWPALCATVRRADFVAAQRVDRFIANSQAVADRIRRHYQRESVVVYPPVELPDRPGSAAREDFYLCVGQHVAYKRLDLAVEACARLGRRLKVIGEGADVERFRAGRPIDGIEFLGYQPDAVVRDHYCRARGLLFPGEEDFGIVPVEAIARGCPVIAFGRGGACETVVEGESGVLFEEQTVESLSAAIEQSERMQFDADAMFASTRRFERSRFQREMIDVIASARREGRINRSSRQTPA